MDDALLQFVGRLHPLILHLPIGMLVALLLLESWGLVRRRAPERSSRVLLAWFVALSAIVAATTGLLLSRESEYGGDTWSLHRWLGLGTATVLFFAAILLSSDNRRGYGVALLLGTALLIPAGHFGGTIVRPADYLTAPFNTVEASVVQNVAPDRPNWYEHDIAPIFAAKCSVCHGETRQKAGLALHSPDAIDAARGVLTEGESGPSELLRRLTLPLDGDEHMPPEGKPQLTAAELAAMTAWIKAGASLDQPRPGDAPDDAPRPTAAREPLPHDAIAAARAARMHVEVIDPELRGLWIDTSARLDLEASEVVALLRPLGPFTADLSLRDSPVADDVLLRCGPWERLRTLDLSDSSVTRSGLDAVATSATLEELALSGTALSDDVTAMLIGLPSLARVHVWASGLTGEAIAQVKRARPDVDVDDGTNLAAAPLETEPEFTLGEVSEVVSLAPINSTCPVSGTAVVARFSIVHDGAVVGFCCEKCAAKFWDDPAAFTIPRDVGN